MSRDSSSQRSAPRGKAERHRVVVHGTGLGHWRDDVRHQAAPAAEDDARRNLPTEQLAGALDALFGQERQGAVSLYSAAENDERIGAV